MVDSTKSIGSIQGIPRPGNKAQASSGKPEAGPASPSENRDEVFISEEAISLAEAQKSTADARAALENDPSLTLGLDPSFASEGV